MKAKWNVRDGHPIPRVPPVMRGPLRDHPFASAMIRYLFCKDGGRVTGYNVGRVLEMKWMWIL